MILEGNNYDLDTLLVYYQDEAITATQVIAHCSDNMLQEYRNYCSKRELEDTEENAQEFLDWWMDEERETEEEDMMDIQELPSMEEEKVDDKILDSWLSDSSIRQDLAFSDEPAIVCDWRYKNPMSKDKEKCASDTGLALDMVEKWWLVPNFIDHIQKRRTSFSGKDSINQISKFLLGVCA